MNANMMKYMANPRAFTLKKWFADMLKENYSPHENIIERVSTSIVTDQDLQDFGKLIYSVYEKGYREAIKNYKTEIERLGVNVVVQDYEKSGLRSDTTDVTK